MRGALRRVADMGVQLADQYFGDYAELKEEVRRYYDNK